MRGAAVLRQAFDGASLSVIGGQLGIQVRFQSLIAPGSLAIGIAGRARLGSSALSCPHCAAFDYARHRAARELLGGMNGSAV